ncbi:multidrug ABC transporter ATPase [Microbacterium horticulturae]|uniref:Multidrug ABC transporter ATPase n=1 Tax=Microbacterium horticulturae TaxID=3028316 RepID=A0ABY8C483_9MICO|nr:multidrug ABC transporter ATPase [Microbacterium sp. KACC 23027]WEG09871.1 multidrug ABC transporter ATPase [Microbacterium sp. KACC 23027]
MSAPTPTGDVPVRRLDRILSFTALGLLVLSVLCFLAIIIGSAMHAQFDQGAWPVIGIAVYVGPIVAFLLIIAVVIMSFVRRARANKAR